MLKLKLQYFGHFMGRANSLEDSDAGKDWRQKEKGTEEDEMIRYHHRFNVPEIEQILVDSAEQKSLLCCSPCSHKELDMT